MFSHHFAFPSLDRLDVQKITLILQAPSAMTHFRGGVVGSNADFKEIGLKLKEITYHISEWSMLNQKWARNLHNFEISGRSLGDRKLHSKNTIFNGFGAPGSPPGGGIPPQRPGAAASAGGLLNIDMLYRKAFCRPSFCQACCQACRETSP